MKTRSATLLLAASLIAGATEPTPETRRWWSHIQALANDSLAGRDVGSEGYRRAALYVSSQFDRLGLKPAGENGYLQSVPMHADRLNVARSSIELVDDNGVRKPIAWLRQITVTANPRVPQTIDAPMVFVGSADYGKTLDLQGKVVVELNPPLLPGAQRVIANTPPRALGILGIGSPLGPEPSRWPASYAVAVTIRGTPANPNTTPAWTFNPEFADLLFEGSGHTYKQVLDLSAQGKPVPNFALRFRLRATMNFEETDIASDNVLAILPGSDPALVNEYVAISAHLDGYGLGEPVKGDSIYNGAFDDAAYVATLIDFAERLKESGTRLRRSVLFVVITGEEKGLLGSRYFTQHPTIPKEQIVADVNLDQLRPLFPLKTLTTVALDQSTLGDTVMQVAQTMNIRIQPDPEPARNLLRRSDNWNFMQMGVPAVGFVFGFEPGSPEEAIYRDWYNNRYHKPADDLDQPWDPAAAAKFNDFFGKLVQTIANTEERPRWTNK